MPIMTKASSALIVAFTLAFITMCSGMRLRTKASEPTCPDKVSLSTKGDCIDDRGLIVPFTCCRHLNDCIEHLEDSLQRVDERLQIYMGNCKVKRDDLGPDNTMADVTRVCSDTCQTIEQLSEQVDVDLDSIRDECGHDARFDTLTRMLTVMKVLDKAWAACSTTTAPVTTTTTSGTELFGPITDSELNTVFVIDVSGSMIAPLCQNFTMEWKCKDVQTTSRQWRCRNDGSYQADCAQYDRSYNWCHTTNDNWDYCSLGPGTTSRGWSCIGHGSSEGTCAHHGKTYSWCRTTNGNWDYCTPSEGPSFNDGCEDWEWTKVCEDVSRWDIVKAELISVIKSLSKEHKFTVVSFNHTVGKFTHDLVPATVENKASAELWIHGRYPFGGTLFNLAMREVLSMRTKVDAVHFLSDGMPSDCQSVDCMLLQHTVTFGRRRSQTQITIEQKPKVHTTLFMPGDDLAKMAQPRELLKGIAQATGGIFREPYPSTPSQIAPPNKPLCPVSAISRLPNKYGDCICPYSHVCTTSSSEDCPNPFKSMPSKYTKYYFPYTCSTCACVKA